MTDQRYVGLMSGTSADGIDAVLLHVDATGNLSLTATRSHPLDGTLKAAIAALCTPGENEIDRLGELDRRLGRAFAEAALALLKDAGLAPQQIAAIGSHGQTVRHRPQAVAGDSATAFSLQIGDPNTIAELTGITTVADFRRRDIAAAGEGAPLVPAFHRDQFAQEGTRRAIVNIGGIANATLLDGLTLRGGFDCGPGNTLLDYWAHRATGADYDAGGAWSAEGSVDPELLKACLEDPFFLRTGPRSTGREHFSADWLQSRLGAMPAIEARNVQATLAELTARSIAGSLEAADFAAQEVYVCGGGSHNADIMRRLYRLLQPARLDTTAALGMHPDWVEAAAFAWLARQRLCNRPGNAPEVTGAAGLRVLGAVYPGATD